MLDPNRDAIGVGDNQTMTDFARDRSEMLKEALPAAGALDNLFKSGGNFGGLEAHDRPPGIVPQVILPRTPVPGRGNRIRLI
jgi:hypothetical protein